MDELKYGTRDKRGNWSPNEPLSVGPLLDVPWSPVRILKWLPSYLFPWNALFMAMALIFWGWLTPSRETLQSLHWSWILYLLVRNSVLILLIYGALELRLYVKRRQGTRFKYNGNFPADQPSDVFMFRSQNIDNIVRSFGSGLPIWTAYEVLLLWSWANGIGPWTMFGDNPWWLAAFALVLPLLHELHFYCIHRLIHVPVLYKWVHSVHHNSVNPSPWSSLSMHPVEHLLYWSGTLIHLLLPSHPLLAAEAITLDDIAEFPYVMLTVDEASQTASRYWKPTGLRPDIVFKTSSVEAVRSMVADGVGVTILSDMVYRPWSLEGQRIELRNVAADIPTMDVGLAWNRARSQSPATRTFHEFLSLTFSGATAPA